MKIVSRSYQGEADLPLLVELINACEAHDHVEDGTSLNELRDEINDPRFDPTRHLWIWETSSGDMVAFAEFHAVLTQEAAQAHPAAFAWFKLLPEVRGIGIEEQIIEWAQIQTQQNSAELVVSLSLEAAARDVEQQRRSVLERLGFQPIRYFWRMARSLTGDLPEPALPAGMTIEAGTLSDSDYVELHNEVWVDHFGYEPWTPDVVAHYRSITEYRREHDLVLFGPDHTPIGFCWLAINADENARTGRQDGWIGLLGIRRAFRGQGIGRALLRAGMQILKESGAEYVRLGVDGASPTGAHGLYQSEGFETTYTRTLYARSV
jgi:mycothiol synthase